MRKIIHIDMDCFYAAIEMRENPLLRDKPVAVGGDSLRSVICTANYKARQYGVHAAMPTRHALKRCPDLVLVPVRIQLYKKVSEQIRAIMQEYTDLVEPLSLDEAYLDVTNATHHNGSATLIAQEIRYRIFQQHALTASAGISINKFLAKVASDWEKPNGQFTIYPEQVVQFVKQLPIRKIFGVGKVTQEKMHRMGVHTCLDLQRFSLTKMVEEFGKFGAQLYQLCRGIDEREVKPHRVRKSLSVEETFEQDLADMQACSAILPKLFLELQQRLQKRAELNIHKHFIKIKFHDFKTTTAEVVATQLSLPVFQSLLEKAFNRGHKAVRLLGVGVGFKELTAEAQEDLFALKNDEDEQKFPNLLKHQAL